MTRFNPKYSQPMLDNLVNTRGWGKVKYRPARFEYAGENRSPEVEWTEKHCKQDVQYRDGYFYFSNPAEATAFSLVWTK
jgi:hypothetical protein